MISSRKLRFFEVRFRSLPDQDEKRDGLLPDKTAISITRDETTETITVIRKFMSSSAFSTVVERGGKREGEGQLLFTTAREAPLYGTARADYPRGTAAFIA